MIYQPYYSVYSFDVIIRAFSQELVYKGGEEYSHHDIMSFEFAGAKWKYFEANSIEWP